MPLWKLAVSLGALFSTAGLIKFWGFQSNWIFFFYVFLFSSLTILSKRGGPGCRTVIFVTGIRVGAACPCKIRERDAPAT